MLDSINRRVGWSFRFHETLRGSSYKSEPNSDSDSGIISSCCTSLCCSALCALPLAEKDMTLGQRVSDVTSRVIFS